MNTNKSEINLWVVRHGYRIDFENPQWRDTAENPYNPPLASVGFEQAGETAEFLKDKNIEHIISSPFLRTVQTANVIGERVGRKVTLEAGLSEWLTDSEFRCKPELDNPADMAKEYPFIKPEQSNMFNPGYPEDSASLDLRIATTITKILNQYENNILIISHGSPIRSVFRALVEYKGEHFPSMCSVNKFTHDSGRWKLEMHNYSSHLTHPDDTRAAFYSSYHKTTQIKA